MTRRRLLPLVLPVALVLLGVGGWALWPSPAVTSPVTEENARRIKGHMTLAEVEEILGPGRAVNAGDNTVRFQWDGPDGFFVTIRFEGTPGRVFGTTKGTFQPETLIERIRRRLGL
jgi:hypothetical protein